MVVKKVVGCWNIIEKSNFSFIGLFFMKIFWKLDNYVFFKNIFLWK